MVTSLKIHIAFFFLAISNKFTLCDESFLRSLYDPSTDPIYDQMYYIRNIQCSSFTNCPAPNNCIDDTTCKCADGFVNLPPPKDSTITSDPIPYCQYKQKSQLTAFLLQFFILHGSGHFYVGNLQYAIPQLIICLCPTLIYIVMCMMGIKIRKTDGPRTLTNLILVLFTCLFFFTMISWWLADVIIFGTNSYNDSNGIPLRAW
jgi:hypothetical protein